MSPLEGLQRLQTLLSSFSFKFLSGQIEKKLWDALQGTYKSWDDFSAVGVRVKFKPIHGANAL